MAEILHSKGGSGQQVPDVHRLTLCLRRAQGPLAAGAEDISSWVLVVASNWEQQVGVSSLATVQFAPPAAEAAPEGTPSSVPFRWNNSNRVE